MIARFAIGVSLVIAGAAGGDSFLGSTIVSNPTDFQPEFIYKAFPAAVPVAPDAPWQLSFGALLDSAPASIGVTLSLDPAGQSAGIQIVDASATFVLADGLHNNYDPVERFELVYTGTLDPFVGPIDFLLTPDGFLPIPVRVHLNVTEQPGFPVSFVPGFNATAPIGDIAGDSRLEIVAPGDVGGVRGLYAFDHSASVLSGWPFRLDEPDVLDQNYATPAVIDLDGDGKDEAVVVAFIQRNTPAAAEREGFEFTTSLFAVNGSGNLQWQATDDIVAFSIPAVADLDGDAVLDIIVGGGANLMRYDANGVRLAGWRVETLSDIAVHVPVIVDVDGVAENGLEILGCTPVFEPPHDARLYVWNEDGSVHNPAWPKALEACHAPAVVDLDGDPTNGREIVMAIGHADPKVDPGTGFLNTFTVFAWHANGTDVTGWPHRFTRDPSLFPDDRVASSPSVGDVDGDGDMEVVVGTYGQGDQANGNLFVFHHDGTLDPNWPRWAGTAQTPSTFGGTALGDLDDDGRLEIVTASFPGVSVFRHDGSQFEGFPRLTTDNFGQPTIADVDGDGRLEIVAVSFSRFLSVWTVLAPSVDSAPWPRFRQNPGRTGATDQVAGAPIPTVSEVMLVATFCLLVGAGGYAFRRDARTSLC